MLLFILQEQLKKLPQIPGDNIEYYEKSGQLMMKMNEKENVNLLFSLLIIASFE